MTAVLLLLSPVATGAFPGIAITFPEDGGVYSSLEMNVRAVMDYESILADSVVFSLNGGVWTPLPELDTDWYTYMQNDLHQGFSESPAPHDATVLWTAPVTSTIHEFPNPVIVDGIVYYPSNMGTDSLYALDALTGAIIWKYWVGTTDDAVTVENGLVYIASDSLYCIDALTGSRMWSTPEAVGEGGGTPAVADGLVYSGYYQYSPGISRITAFDAITGRICWETGITALGKYMASCVTCWNGMLFVPVSNGMPLYCFDASTGALIWSNSDAVGGYWDSSPTVVDGTIYIGDQDGFLRAIDAVSGITIWATYINDAGSAVTATPAYHDGRLYVGADNGPFICADAENGGILWSVDLTIHGSPCVADGLVFFGEYANPSQETSRVIALDCVTGDFVWTYTVQANRFQSTPSVTDGVLYIAAIDGNLYAFGTGYKFSYDGPITAETGWNELIVAAYCPGGTVHSDTVSFLVDPYGIEDESGGLAAPELRILQNPAGSPAMMILMSPSYAAADIRVFALSGRLVVDTEIPEGPDRQMELDVSGMHPGVYLVRWTQEGISGTTRLVVLR